MSIDILTASQHRNFSDILKDTDKKDWDQFYGHCTNEGVIDSEFEADEDDYEEYYDQGRDNRGLDFGADHFVNSPNQDVDFQTLAQAKMLDRTFVAQGNVINVYRESSDNPNDLDVSSKILKNLTFE